jgi:hypothetical protein
MWYYVIYQSWSMYTPFWSNVFEIMLAKLLTWRPKLLKYTWLSHPIPAFLPRNPESATDTFHILFLLIFRCILIDWLVIKCFTFRSRILNLYGDVSHHCRWRAAKYRPTCISAPSAFEQGGIFIVSYLLWHGTSVFLVSCEGPPHSIDSYDTESFLTRILRGPHSVASYATKGGVENLF